MKPRSFSVRRKSDLYSDMRSSLSVACLRFERSCALVGYRRGVYHSFRQDAPVCMANFKVAAGKRGKTGMKALKTAIGLMSGTSMDGIDIALLRTDGDNHVERGPSMGVPYEPGFRERLKQSLAEASHLHDRSARPGDLATVERNLTMRHAVAV